MDINKEKTWKKPNIYGNVQENIKISTKIATQIKMGYREEGNMSRMLGWEPKDVAFLWDSWWIQKVTPLCHEPLLCKWI